MVSYDREAVGRSDFAFCHMPQVDSVSVGLWFRTGARYETPGLHGGAHFLEHMLFKGTARRNALQISQEIESKGGDLNAFTAEEMTCYYARLDADHLELVLDVLFDMLWKSNFPKEELERERGVILEEIRMYEDQPSSLVMEQLNQALWSGHGLGRPITGSPGSVSAMKRGDLMNFWRSHYSPETLVVSVAGGVTRERIHSLTKRYVNVSRTGSKFSAPVFKAPSRSRVALVSVPRPVQQCSLSLGVLAYPKGDKRRYALKLLSVMLGENMSSRLFQMVREKHGLAYSINSATAHFHETGAFYVQAGVDTPKLVKAMKLVAVELERITRKKPDEVELRRAKDYIIGQMKLHLESTTSRMMWMGESLVGLNVMLQPADVIRAIEEVTPSEVQAVARDLFRPGRMALAVVGPEVNDTLLKEAAKPLQDL
ncbi:MAG: pitrilysin family protein [Methylacidiphilales bacterium]|nr:pitrilysin family protein [Candidatus Methylacidiphilales bacterium]